MLGTIYIIQSPNTDKVYIGSTLRTLHERFREHKKPSNNTNSCLVINEGKPYIELLEEVKVIDEPELRFYEQQYLELYSDIAVNEVDAFGGVNKKEYQKKYHEKNREYELENMKKYYQEHKEQIVERVSKKFECSCGGHYLTNNKARHLKSQKHQKYLENVAQE